MENRDIAVRRRTFAGRTNPLLYATLALTMLTAPVSMYGLDYMVNRMAENDASAYSQPVQRIKSSRPQIPMRTLPVPTSESEKNEGEDKKNEKKDEKDGPKQRAPEYPGQNPDQMPVKGAGPSLAGYRTSQAGIDLIKQFEGYRESAYKCQAGVWTVGYGHTGGVGRWTRTNPEQAEQYLKEDLGTAEKAVKSYVKVPLTQGQYDALVSFAYNAGNKNLKDSTLLKEVNARNYDRAANELPRWNKAGGKVSKGLVRRREAERDMFNGNGRRN